MMITLAAAVLLCGIFFWCELEKSYVRACPGCWVVRGVLIVVLAACLS
jgi:ABC-type uncharacterized transport system permease subunit